ncbi:hypothetical protein F4778DRAFT_717260 [Xylariomycetidae sp. FL2044]|nr:hypothetical protein F4778DRAFT_717260 [Xylariomycetidae sp. FL2044]
MAPSMAAIEELNIIILGKGGSGKESLMRRYCADTFDENFIDPFRGENLCKCTQIDGTTCRLDMLAYQSPVAPDIDQFDESHLMIVRRCRGMLYLYEGGSEVSQLEHLMSVRPRYLECFVAGRRPVEAIALTKKDLWNNVSNEEWEKSVDAGRRAAKKIGAAFFVTSALTGEGVQELFEKGLAANMLRSVDSQQALEANGSESNTVSLPTENQKRDRRRKHGRQLRRCLIF